MVHRPERGSNKSVNLYAVQPLDRPVGRVFYIARNRDNNGTTDGQVEQRAGWSYRSWANSFAPLSSN